MKTSSKFLVALLAIFVVTQAHAMRWYSPSTGSWFSRDPIEEAGGLNLSGFLDNDPVNRIDPTGLVGCSSNCKCVSVSVSFDDGSSAVNWHWVREGRSIRFGSTMKVEWTVYGSPGRCKYFQRETGNFIWSRRSGDPGAKSARWMDHEASRKYTDRIGGYFYSPADNGTWQSRVFRTPTITLECQSSDGTKITQSVTVQSPPDPGVFPPP